MNKETENDIWEILLKSAVIESGLNELKTYPPENEISKIIIPEQYDRKMMKLIRRYKNRDIRVMIFRDLKVAVTIFIIFLGISFGFLLQFEEVRAACKKVIMQFYEKYIQVEYREDVSEEEVDIDMEYIPEGFWETEKISNSWRVSLQYENNMGETIYLIYSTQMHTLQIDAEHYSIEDIRIERNVEGKFFESSDKQFRNYILYDDEEGYYVLESTLPKADMIKIAKNINIIK